MKNKIKQTFGNLAVIFVIFFPVYIWATMMPLGLRFSAVSISMTSLGQLTGLVGMALFALALIFGARLKFLEDYFAGLNRIYIKHHLVGSLAFVLLLFHPLFLVTKYLSISVGNAAAFLLPSMSNLPRTYGIISLAIMILLLALTFYGGLKYHVWKMTHKYLGLAYLAGFLHILLIQSDISRDLTLKLFFIIISIFALAVYSYWTVLGKLLVAKSTYKIGRINQLSRDIVEIAMEPIGAKLKYIAGQFGFFKILQPGISAESHPYSFISSPNENEIRVAIKFLGDYTEKMKSVQLGSGVEIEGPFGKFTIDKKSSLKQIWVAGGIGITPFLSLATEMEGRQVDLYYCVKNKEEAVFIDRLATLSSSNQGLKVIPFFSEKEGKINADAIRKISGELANKDIYLCGPSAMMRSLRNQLIAVGANQSHIHSEEFAF